MTVFDTLALALTSACNVVIELDGDQLKLLSHGPPPNDVLEALKANKQEIMALLAEGDRWRARFDERVDTIHQTAQARAFDHCVIEWLNEHQERSSPDRCLVCGHGDRSSDPLLPFGAGPGNERAWRHHGCWSNWTKRRRRMAEIALNAFGLHPECQRAYVSADARPA